MHVSVIMSLLLSIVTGLSLPTPIALDGLALVRCHESIGYPGCGQFSKALLTVDYFVPIRTKQFASGQLCLNSSSVCRGYCVSWRHCDGFVELDTNEWLLLLTNKDGNYPGAISTTTVLVRCGGVDLPCPEISLQLRLDSVGLDSHIFVEANHNMLIRTKFAGNGTVILGITPQSPDAHMSFPLFGKAAQLRRSPGLNPAFALFSIVFVGGWILSVYLCCVKK
jgi:hypothetical protein